MIGVYKITSPSGRIYVGSSLNIEYRFKQYKRLNCKAQPRLYRSIMKYGWEAHTFEIIAITPPEKRFKWEHILGMYYNVLGESGLTCQLPGYDDVPKRLSEECKNKIAMFQRGKPKTPEAIEKTRQANLGRKASEKTRQLQSKAKKGKKQNPEAVLARNLKNTGRKRTTEQKLKMSNSITGLKQTEEHKENRAKTRRKPIIDLNTGIIYSCVKELVEYFDLNIFTLRAKLNGTEKNNTSFRYNVI